MHHDFGMFTDEGNYQVALLVTRAHEEDYSWPETLKLLEKLSKEEGFGEAMDTDVREGVYVTLGFDTEFYV
jgi:hypothetical protein